MLRFWAAAVLCLGSAGGWAQSDTRPGEGQTQPTVAETGLAAPTVEVFRAGGSVTMPQLQQGDLTNWIASKCDQKFSGKTVLGMVVDAEGHARNLQILSSAVNDADRLALLVALQDRFTPGTSGGAAVPVSLSLEMKIEGCVVQPAHSGTNDVELRLRSMPVQKVKAWDGAPRHVRYASSDMRENTAVVKVGGSIRPPVPIVYPEAEFSDKGRREGIEGECMISVIVNQYGLPVNPRIVKSLEPSMDEKALAAVWKSRFRPAMRDGVEPVPVMITIALNFRM